MHIKSIEVKGLRSLVNPGPLQMKPLTLMVGANSAGKSTMLRTIPLLRQSVETRTRGPLLWFGDDGYVDFGSFDTALNHNSSSKEIEFSFEVGLSPDDNGRRSSVNFLSEANFKIRMILGKTENGATQAKAIKVEGLGHVIELEINAESEVSSVTLDGDQISEPSQKLIVENEDSLVSLTGLRRVKIQGGDVWARIQQYGIFRDKLLRHVEHLFHGGTTVSKKVSFINSLGVGDQKSSLADIRSAAQITTTSAKKIKFMRHNSSWFNELHGLIMVYNLDEILGQVDGFLLNTLKNSSYIGPLRATAQRFYRQQELSINEVDAEGSNLAMFLMGLSQEQQIDFSDWCQDRVGFGVKAVAVGAHASVNLTDFDEGKTFNIADMGFGYSQLLPVLATVWQSENQKSISPSSIRARRGRMINWMGGPRYDLQKIISIEQPELHLHPKFQGKLAELFSSIAQGGVDAGKQVNIICETHSETMINRIGRLVSEGKISSNSVQVLLFDKDDATGETTIRESSYDSSGVLTNWPFGFFLP